MTKIFKLCLVPIMAAVLLWCLSAQVYAAEATEPTTTGYCGAITESEPEGKNIMYTISDNNTKLTISGNGAMADYANTNINNYSPFYAYKDTLTTLVFEEKKEGEEGITHIGDYAFLDLWYIKGDLVLPDTVTSIGNSAFYDCNALENVTIPYGVITIGDAAFDDCDGLKSVIIPDSVTTIGVSAFCDCFSLTHIEIPNSVTNVGVGLFENCESLESVIISDSLTTISDYMFLCCSVLKDITIPSSVTTIGSEAFNWCTSLTSISIPSSVTSVGSDVFKNCTALTSIDLSTNDTSIANTLLSSCGDAVQISEMTVLSSTDTIDDATLAKIKRLRCFKGSTADDYALSDTQEKVHIQHQKAFNILIRKPDDGKWIQRVDVCITKGGTQTLRKFEYYSLDENKGIYTFPVLMYADSYLGDEPDLTYEVRYFYNYSSDALTDEEILSDPKDISQDTATSRLNKPKQIYYQIIPLDDVPFTIQEVK